jgi:hypothetical protein
MRRFTALTVALFVISMLAVIPALAQVPPPPLALPPDNITPNAFHANWDISNKVAQGIDIYYLDVSVDPTFVNVAAYVDGFHDAPVGGPWNNVTGVFPFNTYYYRLRAHNVNGTSDYSNYVAAPLASPTIARGATDFTPTGFTAHWDALNGATGYRLDIAKLSSFGPVVHTTVWDSAITGSSFTVSGLAPDTTYFYRVRTVSGAGTSDNSNSMTVSRIISAPLLASGTVNVPYSVTIQFQGTQTPTSGWTVTSGALPTGLSLDPATGTIGGTPTAPGTFNFTAQCTDATPAQLTRSFTINIVSSPTIAFDAAVGNTYTYNNGAPVGSTITWNHTVGAGSNRMLVVQVGATDPNRDNLLPTSVTYNGKPLTLVKEQRESTAEPSLDYLGLSVWYLLEKDLPTDGIPHAVVAIYPGSTTTGEGGGSISLFNVRQAAPESAVSDSAYGLNGGTHGTLTAHITTLTNHAWLLNACVDDVSGGFFNPRNQEPRYQIDNGAFDFIGDTKEVLVAGPDSMQADNHLDYRMAQVVIAVAPLAPKLAYANVKVFLQGPYVAAGDTMANTLRKNGWLATHFGSIPIPVLAIDSINIELRDSATAAAASHRRFAPAWLLTNGTLRGFADTTQTSIAFDSIAAGKYYVVIRHRNHLAIMSSQKDSIDNNSAAVAYDFSTGQTQAYGTNAMKAVGTRFALFAGNGNGDGSINAVDRNSIWRVQNGAFGYFGGDFDLNGTVNAVDQNGFWRVNNGNVSQVP